MTTQTLRGLKNVEPFHWRGDRQNFQHFNQGFVALMGMRARAAARRGCTGTRLPGESACQGLSTRHGRVHRLHHDGELPAQPVPQPRRHDADRRSPCRPRPAAAPRPPATRSTGNNIFVNQNLDGGVFSCNHCHALPDRHHRPTSSTATSRARPRTSRSRTCATCTRRSASTSSGPNLQSGNATNIGLPTQKKGFGFIHDGSVSLTEFLAASVFTSTTQQERDLFAFMLAFPTESVPAIGRQVDGDRRQQERRHASSSTIATLDRAGRDDRAPTSSRRASSAASPRGGCTTPAIEPARAGQPARRRRSARARCARRSRRATSSPTPGVPPGRRRPPRHRPRSRRLARPHARPRWAPTRPTRNSNPWQWQP